MSTPSPELGEQIAEAAGRLSAQVGCVESLTSGSIASRLGAAPTASEWFRGGLVTYATQVKRDLLGVGPGPVVTAECAEQMARGAVRFLGADHVVAVTGVGGPDPEEHEPPGTVWFGLLTRSGVSAHLTRFDGPPEEVVRRTTDHALALLARALRESLGTARATPSAAHTVRPPG